jgi:hypothetical protein
MWWHGGARLIERSERGTSSAVATHDVFGWFGFGEKEIVSGHNSSEESDSKSDERSKSPALIINWQHLSSEHHKQKTRDSRD